MFVVKKAAVVGAGFMGGSIALLCARNGIETVNIDQSSEQLERAKLFAEKSLTRLIEKSVMNADEVEEIRVKLTYSTNIKDIETAEIVIEAVPEDINLKIKVLEQIEKHAGETTIILSNTSGLSISKIAENLGKPDKIMCAHFFSPPDVMKLVEVIKGDKTSEDTFRKTVDFVLQIGKEPVNAPELPGFIVNRLLIPLINEASYLLMQGACKEDIDKAMKLGANHKMGPLELGDFIGLDVVLAIMQTLHKGLNDEKYRPCPLLEDLVIQGKLGRKTKEGFYIY